MGNEGEEEEKRNQKQKAKMVDNMENWKRSMTIDRYIKKSPIQAYYA